MAGTSDQVIQPMSTDDEIIQRLVTRIQTPSARTSRGYCEVFPPASEKITVAAESELGFALFPLLRRMYKEVANGGFGPGYGLVGLSRGYRDEEGRSLCAVYRWKGWADGTLPLWDWGDATWSCLDIRSPDGTIVTHDAHFGAFDTSFTIHTWLNAWLQGVNVWNEIFDMDAAPTRTGINPFTKKPLIFRGHGRPKGAPRKRS